MGEFDRRVFVVPAVGLVVAALVVLVLRSPVHYVSAGTYVLSVTAEDDNDRARALANLGDEPKITTTYSILAASDAVISRAIEDIGVEPELADELSVTAERLRGSSIIRVAVSGPDESVVRDMAAAVGDEAIRFSASIDDLYELQVLDPPGAAEQTRPGPTPSDLLLALLAGGGAAGGVSLTRFGRRRDRDTGSPDEPTLDDPLTYTAQRLRTEKARTHAGGGDFQVVVMTVLVKRHMDASDAALSPPRRPDPRRIRQRLAGTLRGQDHFCAFGDDRPGTYAAILPGVDRSYATTLADLWREETEDQLRRRRHPQISIDISTCTYGASTVTGDPAAAQLVDAL